MKAFTQGMYTWKYSTDVCMVWMYVRTYTCRSWAHPQTKMSTMFLVTVLCWRPVSQRRWCHLACPDCGPQLTGIKTTYLTRVVAAPRCMDLTSDLQFVCRPEGATEPTRLLFHCIHVPTGTLLHYTQLIASPLPSDFTVYMKDTGQPYKQLSYSCTSTCTCTPHRLGHKSTMGPVTWRDRQRGTPGRQGRERKSVGAKLA